jgi:uncharacterized lipoprotein
VLEPPRVVYTRAHTETDRRAPTGQPTPSVSQTRAELAVDRRDLAVDEVASDEVTTTVTIVPRRTH